MEQGFHLQVCIRLIVSEDDTQVDKVTKSSEHQKTNTQTLLDKQLALKDIVKNINDKSQ